MTISECAARLQPVMMFECESPATVPLRVANVQCEIYAYLDNNIAQYDPNA